ncbi:MAG: beta galactosidase jelly roll domain-containing protein [Firmicutes bacterium]|nr:beta galactosidase jelly roll domain-containing protein [Bacillota bacterium]MDD4264235.1 beta galactosidase jelly roll domain-containing protein [Bacillota bacterium]MDD4693754.1 beta galactosidase jelly roll domain-containing protein [Bacillota bacterium]
MTKKIWFAGILSLVFVGLLSFVVMAEGTIVLDGKWVFQFDDDLAWADPDYDVSDWESYAKPADAPALGFGWYRYDFELPEDWEGKGDLELNIAELYDFDWTFINGIGIGNGNRSGKRTYSIPASYLNFDGKNTLALRVYTINPGIGLDGNMELTLTDSVSLLKNPSFEVPVNTPAKWTATGTDKNVFFWEEAATVRTGFRAVGLKGTDALAEKEGAWMSDIMLVTPGNEYRAQAYVKAEDPTGETTIQIRFYNADGDEVLYENERAVSRNLGRRTSDWTRGNLYGTAPEDAAYARVCLVSKDNSGIVWFDDVAFTLE